LVTANGASKYGDLLGGIEDIILPNKVKLTRYAVSADDYKYYPNSTFRIMIPNPSVQPKPWNIPDYSGTFQTLSI
jgi:hypothetical protein